MERKIITASMQGSTTLGEVRDFKNLLEGYFGVQFKVDIDKYAVSFIEVARY